MQYILESRSPPQSFPYYIKTAERFNRAPLTVHIDGYWGHRDLSAVIVSTPAASNGVPGHRWHAPQGFWYRIPVAGLDTRQRIAGRSGSISSLWEGLMQTHRPRQRRQYPQSGRRCVGDLQGVPDPGKWGGDHMQDADTPLQEWDMVI